MMNNQVFASAHECAAQIVKLRGQGVACRLQKVDQGFAIVLMNGKVQRPKAKVEKTEAAVTQQRESNFNVDEVMQDIHAQVHACLKENEGLHEDDQIKVLDFDITYRPVKRSSLWKLFVPINKAAVMLTYINTHACNPDFPPLAAVDVFEKGLVHDLFVSLSVVIRIEDGDIPDALHRKLIEKFQ